MDCAYRHVLSVRCKPLIRYAALLQVAVTPSCILLHQLIGLLYQEGQGVLSLYRVMRHAAVIKGVVNLELYFQREQRLTVGRDLGWPDTKANGSKLAFSIIS